MQNLPMQITQADRVMVDDPDVACRWSTSVH
jgi:hypothetical protein